MEATVITTLELTKVYKNVPKCFDLDKDVVKTATEAVVKNAMGADSVVVTNVQQFNMDNSSENTVLVDRDEEFREAARPLIEYIRRNWNPHTKVIVDIDTAEVVTGELVEKFEI